MIRGEGSGLSFDHGAIVLALGTNLEEYIMREDKSRKEIGSAAVCRLVFADSHRRGIC